MPRLNESQRQLAQAHKDAFYRDREKGASCWICHRAIDYTLPYGSSEEAYSAYCIIDSISRPDLQTALFFIRAAHTGCKALLGGSESSCNDAEPIDTSPEIITCPQN